VHAIGMDASRRSHQVTHIPNSPDVAAVLADLQHRIVAALGADLVGLYVFGSLVYGDFTPGTSDLDLLAVTRRPMTGADIDRLRDMHDGIVARHPAWDGRIEVAYQSEHGLRTWATECSPMGIISPGEPIHLIDAGADWRINWWFVLDHGVTLLGPPPETLIAPIPREVFVAASRELGLAWRERIHDITDQRGESYAILTTCRALVTHRTGEHVSKQRAAAWVAGRHPEWADLIAMALERRVSAEDNGPVDTFTDTVRFIAWASAELDEPPSRDTNS
jgi:hypothetical protein